MEINYIVGGRLGDFFHMLAPVKYNYELTGRKGNIYLSSGTHGGDYFNYNITITYKELLTIIPSHEYINNIEIYNGQHIDINLNDFRNRLDLTWSERIACACLDKCKNLPHNYKWINCEYDDSFHDSFIINKKYPINPSNYLEYEKLLEVYKNKTYFICFEEQQYNNFLYKSNCNLIKVDILYDFFFYINSSTLFLGDESAPFVFATSLCKNRIIEPISKSTTAYFNEHLHYDNIKII